MQGETAISAVLAGGAEALAGRAACEPLEADAFSGFYGRTARPLWAYLARVGGDAALADDLMQESYVRFLCAAAPQDGEVAARRYLFRIATNLLRDHWRRPHAESLDAMPEEVFAAHGGGAEAALTLGPALNRMRPRERQLLWLAYAEGYSHKEIAEVTGLATASVRLLLFRARRHAAKLLREGGAA
jgi:RNA polymerase sigma-70 factor (ECF subfamily)